MVGFGQAGAVACDCLTGYHDARSTLLICEQSKVQVFLGGGTSQLLFDLQTDFVATS